AGGSGAAGRAGARGLCPGDRPRPRLSRPVPPARFSLLSDPGQSPGPRGLRAISGAQSGRPRRAAGQGVSDRARAVRRRRLLGGVAVWALHAPVLRAVAHALVVEDALADADALVVVAGDSLFREQAASDLFKQGWAPRIVVSRPVNPPSVAALLEMGVRPL